MQTILILLFLLPALLLGFSSCGKDEPPRPPQAQQPVPPGEPDKPDEDNNDTPMNNLTITVNNASFPLTLEDNAAARAFGTRLPMTISMAEMNGNEKYANLSGALPASSLNPGTIRTGDLMLFGAATLVLFYETFSTPYSYTRLGRVSDPSGLSAALGTGSVTVTFQTSDH